MGMQDDEGGTAVLLERDGGLALVTLNRPEAYNALNIPLAQGLLDAMIACDEDPGVRAVMIIGSGKAFCAGGDIRSMRANADADGNAGAFLKKLTVPLHGAIATMAHMAKPVVGAVNGVAAGAGFSLALACDLLVASEKATFTMAYTKIGLAPDGSSTYFLPRLVGAKRAYDLIATNRALSARDAVDAGLVSATFPDKDFAAQARNFAATLAAGPTRALGSAKLLLAASSTEPLETQMEHERRAIGACGNTEDFREGTRAFVENREPKYVGR